MTDPTQDSAPSDSDANSLLVSTGRVDSLKVYSRDGEHLGHVHSLMLDKGSGTATFGVLALGGFLGLGKSYYPLPFQLLQYDRPTDHYVVTIDKRVLEGGPSWQSTAPAFTQAYADRVSNYYGQPFVNVAG